MFGLGVSVKQKDAITLLAPTPSTGLTELGWIHQPPAEHSRETATESPVLSSRHLGR